MTVADEGMPAAPIAASAERPTLRAIERGRIAIRGWPQGWEIEVEEARCGEASVDGR